MANPFRWRNAIFRKLEQRERESTGIDTLKIGFNAVHGYYIQISQGQSHKAPEFIYVRRQTFKKMPSAILFLN